VNRSTVQPAPTSRFCRARSRSNCSAETWYAHPSSSTTTRAARNTRSPIATSSPSAWIGALASHPVIPALRSMPIASRSAADRAPDPAELTNRTSGT
jgi:hypothetical protein